jgi:hypothetical protein
VNTIRHKVDREGSGKAGSGDDEQAQGSISPLDLYVAMNLDHSKLGMNWSVLLEKILLRAFWDQ